MIQAGDKLRLDFINSLPQPFIAVFIGSGDEWEVHDIDVETGMMRIIVCGLLQVKNISDVREFIDAEHQRHDADSFYVDYEPT